MKLPTQNETEALIRIADNSQAMRLLHNFPRKIVKLLCAALQREYEMRLSRDRRIKALIAENERQRELYRAALAQGGGE